MTTGERIKRLRKERGMTQSELAAAISTTKSSVCKYEKGTIIKVPFDVIVAIARSLHVTVEYFIEEEDYGIQDNQRPPDAGDDPGLAAHQDD